MATQSISSKPAPDYADESRFERINSRMVERPWPGDNHAQVQLNAVLLLREYAKTRDGTALQEWSVTQPETASWDDPNYMTPDVLLALQPFRKSKRGHLIAPGFLAVEVASPEQNGLFTKAERYHAWGIEHVWIINPQSRECFEYHGGNQVTIAKEELHAGDLRIPIPDLF